MEQMNRILAVREIMKERENARTNQNFDLSDKLRSKLSELGVKVIDQKNGPSGWKFIDGSTNKIHPGLKPMKVDPNVMTWKDVKDSSAEKKKRKHDDTSDATEDKPTSSSSSSSNKKAQQDQTKVAATSTSSNPQSSKQQQQSKPSTSATVTPSSSTDKNANKKQKTNSTSSTTSSAINPEIERNKKALGAVIQTPSNVTIVGGVVIEELSVGNGATAKNGHRLKMHYVGKLKTNNNVFDSSINKKPFVFKLGKGEVIKGWDIGCAGMRVNGKRRLTIPPEKGYGRGGAPPSIPGNATLVFDITLLEVM